MISAVRTVFAPSIQVFAAVWAAPEHQIHGNARHAQAQCDHQQEDKDRRTLEQTHQKAQYKHDGGNRMKQMFYSFEVHFFDPFHLAGTWRGAGGFVLLLFLMSRKAAKERRGIRPWDSIALRDAANSCLLLSPTFLDVKKSSKRTPGDSSVDSIYFAGRHKRLRFSFSFFS